MFFTYVALLQMYSLQNRKDLGEMVFSLKCVKRRMSKAPFLFTDKISHLMYFSASFI